MNDPGHYLETATFCKQGDEKRPSEVGLIDLSLTQVCPADRSQGVPMVMDAEPTAWYVRIVFDELLDPDVEDLMANIDPVTMEPDGTFTGTLANTQPVRLTCGGMDVPYDGYYSPSGNFQTWPLGPSLVIIPDDPTSVPTGTMCEVTINEVVVDKSGVAVPAAQRGGFGFGIADLQMLATDPGAVAEPTVDNRNTTVPEAPVTLTFNTVIDPASITTAEVLVFKGITAADCSGGTQVPAASVRIFQLLDDAPPDGVVADETSIQIGDASEPMFPADPTDPTMMGLYLSPSETYRIEFATGADVQDAAGGTAPLELPPDEDGNPTILCFDTDAAS